MKVDDGSAVGAEDAAEGQVTMGAATVGVKPEVKPAAEAKVDLAGSGSIAAGSSINGAREEVKGGGSSTAAPSNSQGVLPSGSGPASTSGNQQRKSTLPVHALVCMHRLFHPLLHATSPAHCHGQYCMHEGAVHTELIPRVPWFGREDDRPFSFLVCTSGANLSGSCFPLHGFGLQPEDLSGDERSTQTHAFARGAVPIES